MRLTGYLLYLLLAVVAGVASASAQNVHFMSAPVTNACPYPWTLTLNSQNTQAIYLAPAQAKVINDAFVTSLLATNGVTYIPQTALAVHPGTPCTFHQCGPASISLACFPIQEQVSVIFTAR